MPEKAVDAATAKLNKTITAELKAKTASILTKETKEGLKQVQKTINRGAFQMVTNAVADFVGGIIGGQANELSNNGTSNAKSNPQEDKKNNQSTNNRR